MEFQSFTKIEFRLSPGESNKNDWRVNYMGYRNMNVSDSIISHRLAPNTLRQYEKKVRVFLSWIAGNYPDFIVGDELNFSLITSSILKEFFGFICQKRNNITRVSSDGIAYQSYQHVSGFKSAIKNFYRCCGVTFDEEADKMLKDFFDGYERKIADLKQKGEISTMEGKQPLTFAGYMFLANKALRTQTDFNLNIFAHTFLLFSWNLMSRCTSVATLMFNHISWKDDALVIVFPQHKGDKEGRNSYPKHVYANTANPAICPILSFAIFVFTSGFRREGARNTVFGFGGEIETRFSKWLHTICEANKVELLEMGILIGELGTHSFRKGVATFLSGLNGGPSAIQIYLRAGWSLGNVQNRYIFDGPGGDQLCGRAATGLCLTDKEFSNLPPHFNQTNGAVLTADEWNFILPGYSSFYCQSFRQVVPYLLASIIYHREFIQQILPSTHPIFYQRFWNPTILSKLTSKIQTGCGKNSVTHMFATGIPPHIVLSNELARVTERLESMDQNIFKKLDWLPQRIKDCLLENFQINGAVPITHSDVKSMIDDLKKSLLEAFGENNSRRILNEPDNQANINPENSSVSYRSFTWAERIHPVPDDFRFPKCNCRTLWDLWWRGKPVDNIAPFKVIKSFDISNKSDKVLFSKAKFVIEALSKFNSAFSIQNLHTYTSNQLDVFFETSYVGIFRRLSPDQFLETLDRRRIGDMSYVTFYDLLKKSNTV